MQAMKNRVMAVLNFLDGYKTYIGGSIIFIGGGLRAIEVINDDMFRLIETIGISITAVGLKHAISKVVK